MTDQTEDATERTADTDDLPVIKTDVVLFDPVARDLAMLQHELQGVVYDLTTKAGEEAARRDRRTCVSMRSMLDDAKTDAKADLLRQTRAIDAAYKLIRGAILALEEPIDQQIKAKEATEAAERQRKADEIAARQKAMRAAMLEAFAVQPIKPGVPKVEHLAAELERIGLLDTGALFGDMQPEADDLRAAAMQALATSLAEARALAAEQAALAQQRAEQAAEAERLAAQRKEQEAAEAERRKAEEQRQAAERERQAAEQKEREDKLRAEAAELARQRAAFEAEQAEARRVAAEAEAKRLADIKAEEDRKAAEAKRIADEQAEQQRLERAERERVEAERVAKLEQQAAAAPRMLAALKAWRVADDLQAAGADWGPATVGARRQRDDVLLELGA